MSADARFTELYDLYYRKVVLYCRRRTHPDFVDDAVADTFLTAWRKIDDVPIEGAALPWLYSVAYRTIGHQYRSSQRRLRLNQKLTSIGLAPVSDTGELVVMNQEAQQVLAALSRLRPIERELLRLAMWEELTSSEMAAVLGITQAAAKKRFARAKKALARSYQRFEKTNSFPAAQKGGTW